MDQNAGGGGVNSFEGMFEPPISDNSVSTTCTGGGGVVESDWNGVVGAGSVASNDVYVDDYSLAHSGSNQYSEFEIEDAIHVGVAVAGSGGGGRNNLAANGERMLRSKNAFKSNLKATIKSGLKTAANWILNIFNKTSSSAHPRNGPFDGQTNTGKMGGKSKSKLTRHDSINSSLHSNSYYSSVLGSDNSNSQFTSSNSYSSNQIGQQYGGQSYGGGGGVMTSGQLNRCNSYDPISIGGSSRRSSESSCASLAAATVNSICSSAGRRSNAPPPEPKHLKQTDNLVIQPQSLALSSEQFIAPAPPPPPPPPAPTGNQITMMDSMLPAENQTVPAAPPATVQVKAEIHATTEAINDSMSNLILPDDMVCGTDAA